jgi:nickel/cobalt transporter (NiCoT) family protein
MTTIDSLDSIVMLYSYAGFPEQGWAIFVQPDRSTDIKSRHTDEEQIVHVEQQQEDQLQEATIEPTDEQIQPVPFSTDDQMPERDVESAKNDQTKRNLLLKHNTMSNLSIILTLMSILVAFVCVRSSSSWNITRLDLFHEGYPSSKLWA